MSDDDIINDDVTHTLNLKVVNSNILYCFRKIETRVVENWKPFVDILNIKGDMTI